jgi:hypothetical protein
VKLSQALHVNRETICRIVEAHRARNPRVFGSTARGEDREDSDLDLLVDATEYTTLLHAGGIQYDLQHILGVRVDVRTFGDLHPRMRTEVLREASEVELLRQDLRAALELLRQRSASHS